MYLYKFDSNDIFVNSLQAKPAVEFFVLSGSIYYNNTSRQGGSLTASIVAPSGNISLYELNVDRPSDSKVGQFAYKDGSNLLIRGWSTSSYLAAEPGAEMTATMPATATFSRYYYDSSAVGSSRIYVNALKNTLNFYTILSPHYQFSSSLGDKSTQLLNLVDIPSIFYGSEIRKKTAELNVYYNGTLAAQLKDHRGNGELIQTLPTGPGSGSVAGVVLYTEGFFILTGSWENVGISDRYRSPSAHNDFRWIDFMSPMTGSSFGYSIEDTTFNMRFNGETETQVITMLARAPRGKVNFSNNPTYIDKSTTATSSSLSSEFAFIDSDTRRIKNIVSASYHDTTASFEKTTYISKIALYDENKNVIGIAKLAQPIKKLESRDFTFKLKLDI
jgi:hypothetical protein